MLIANKSKVPSIRFFPSTWSTYFFVKKQMERKRRGSNLSHHGSPRTRIEATCTLLFKQTKVPCVHWFRLRATSLSHRVYVCESWTALISGQPLCRLFALVRPCPYRSRRRKVFKIRRGLVEEAQHKSKSAEGSTSNCLDSVQTMF